jgi:membrane protein YdbS with pleckstrin-like domain
MIWVRMGVTVFVAAILTIVVMGWSWTGANQPPAGAFASRIVFTITALAALVCVVKVWRWRPADRVSSSHR